MLTVITILAFGTPYVLLLVAIRIGTDRSFVLAAQFRAWALLSGRSYVPAQAGAPKQKSQPSRHDVVPAACRAADCIAVAKPFSEALPWPNKHRYVTQECGSGSQEPHADDQNIVL